MVLVSNKTDLETMREVPVDEGRRIAQDLGVPYFEASARDQIGVEEPFHQLVRDIRIFRAANAPIRPKTTGGTRMQGCSLL